jgi:hypothetical protein
MPACAPVDSPEGSALELELELELLDDWVCCESPGIVGVVLWLVKVAAVEASLDVAVEVVEVVNVPEVVGVLEVVVVELSRVDEVRGVAAVYPPPDAAAFH